MDKCEWAILGAGALGSIIGAHLARSGHQVVLLARGQRAHAVEQEGLRIKGLEEFTQRVPVVTDPAKFKGADVFVVATKTNGTQAALEPYRHAAIGTAFSVQNGVMKDDQMIALWGKEHVLGALADTSGELLPNGEVLFTRNESIYVGELQGDAGERSRHIAKVLDGSGVRATAVNNIESLEWSKYTAWVGLMALAVTTRAPTGKFTSDPDLALVLAKVVREMGVLAAARKIPLSNQSPLPVATLIERSENEAAVLIQAGGRDLQTKAPGHRMSSLQDLEAGRALEVEETLGYAVREAARLQLSLPNIATLYSLVSGIDRIRR